MSDRLEETIERHIATYGWHAQHVGGDAGFPAFTYSIGFGFDRGWPEVVIVGARQGLAQAMLWRVWENGRRPVAGTSDDGILDGFTCCLLAVEDSWRRFLFGRAIDAYAARELAGPVAVQCAWPTTSGVLPWEPHAPDGFADLQPRLDRPKPHELTP